MVTIWALAVTGLLVIGAGSASAAGTRVSEATGASAKHKVYLLDCKGGTARIKPQFIMLACGDGGEYVRKASWTHWGDATATAVGTMYAIRCVPACYDGTLLSGPAKITVTGIKTRHGRHEYGHIRVGPLPPNQKGLPTWNGPLTL